MNCAYVFQKDLRLEANALLQKAIVESSSLDFIIIKPIDYDLKDELGFEMWSKAKKKFYLQGLEDLASKLIAGNKQLIFLESYEHFKDYLSSSQIDQIYVAASPFSYENKIRSYIPNSVNIVSESTDSLIDFKLIEIGTDSKFSFTKFRKKVEKQNWPILKLKETEVFFKDIKYNSTSTEFNTKNDIENKGSEIHKSNIKSNEQKPRFRSKSSALDWCQSELKNLGSTEISFDLNGSKDAALEHIKNYIWTKKHIQHYKKTRNGMIEFYDSSKISGWLATGVLSPVEIFNQILDYEKKNESNSSTYWLKLELLWRDYFKLLAQSYQNLFFHELGMEENSLNENISVKDNSLFDKWRLGQTKNQFINANMIELKNTGFMSNRGRQNVVSYLVHELNLPWHWGAKWFESQLIDYDPASNYGNWQYISGVGIWGAHKFDYNWQSETYDPDKAYQKKWLSKL